jgi:hypothetical protein
LVPVRAAISRIAHNRGVSGSTPSKTSSCPFTFSFIAAASPASDVRDPADGTSWKLTGRAAAANDDPVAGDEDSLDVELHIWDRLGEGTGDSDGVVTVPALARNIPPARLVVRRKDLFLRAVIAPWHSLFNQPVQGDMKTLPPSRTSIHVDRRQAVLVARPETALAAVRITSITKLGWDSMGTWLLSTS